MAWNLLGLTLALAVAALAWRRSCMQGGFYDAEVYGMTAAMHRRYAFVSLAFAVYFAFTLACRFFAAGITGLALYALIAIFYAASFLRGFEDAP